MDDLMTTRQLQQLLHVDRITIYRMLEDGRLPGFKVGGQWRFPRREVEKWLQGQRSNNPATAGPELLAVPVTATAEPAAQSPLPTTCMQAIQDILAEATESGAITMSAQGAPLTAASRPCTFCSLILSTEEGRRRCLSSWQALAATPTAGKPAVCHAGLGYLVHQVNVNGEVVADVMLGQLRSEQLARADLEQRSKDLAQACGLPAQALCEALAELPVQCEQSLSRAARLLRLTARTFAEMGRERTQLLGRLQRIAEMTVLD